MKTAILPQVRIEPQLRADLEAVLRKGESLSEFVEASVRSAIDFRRVQDDFHARGEASWLEYRRTGEAYPAGDVLAELRAMTEARRKLLGV